MARIKEICSFLGQYLWTDFGKFFFLVAQIFAYTQNSDSLLIILLSLIPYIYWTVFFLRWSFKLFLPIKKIFVKIIVYISLGIAYYFLGIFLSASESLVLNFFSEFGWMLLISQVLLPFYALVKNRRSLNRRLTHFSDTSKLMKFFKFIFSPRVFISTALLFWYSYQKFHFDLESTENVLIVMFIFYFPTAFFILSLAFLRKISRFFSVPIAILGILSVPLMYYLTSWDVNASATFLSFYLGFHAFALPLAVASILLLLLSIPAFFRLIFRKPQYFMFSFFLLLFLAYAITVEYRFYKQFNGYEKFFCSYQDTKDEISSKVVRIVGSYSEGSGFFIDENRVVTNRHVVNGEDYPKVVLPTGDFLTPARVEMSTDYDIALLYLDEKKPQLVIDTNPAEIASGEEVLSFGYALGSDIKGGPTILPLRYENTRSMAQDDTVYYQFSSSMVSGMSGGPVVDKCGHFVGINTMTTSGTSLVISPRTFLNALSSPTSVPKRVALKPGETPTDSVYAYYYLLKARDTRGCYGLLSKDYKTRSTYEEWTARFPNVISVEVFYVTEIKPNLVYVIFGMSEWVNGEQVHKSYEGTWETVLEGGAYHLNKSYILEMDSIYDLKGPDYFLNPEKK